jgi:glycerate dehydrogenase
MKIVVLDGYTINPGDLSWDGLNELGDLVVYDSTPAGEIVNRSINAEIILTNKTPLEKNVLDNLPGLKYIGVLATGYNVIDVAEAKKHGIVVTNVPGYASSSVAQMTFALLLELCFHVQRHSDSVMAGKWANSGNFCYWDYPLVELSDKIIGIIGFGNIGRKVAEIAFAFGMKILWHDKVDVNLPRNKYKKAELSDLLEQSDAISIHCPLTPETEGMINRDNIRKMKKSAFLINTARGAIIVENDLAEALNQGIISGAGLDVLSIEPPVHNNPLFGAKNCIITPHISWATRESRSRCMNIAVNNLESFLRGENVNVVNQ